MDFETAMERLNVVELTVPGVKRAYKFMPPMSKTIEHPCFLHLPVSFRRDPHIGSWQTLTYDIRTQLFVGKVESGADTLSVTAMAMNEAFITAFNANLRLADSATYLELDGEDGAQLLDVLEWAGQGYVGLNYMIRMQINAPATFAP